MNIEDRVARRRRSNGGLRLVREYDALSPAAHVRDPSSRGAAFEELLDHLEPALGGGLPPTGYVWGPKGAGKSALVTALFAELDRVGREATSSIHTTTRVEDAGIPAFAYVDARATRSEFGLRHAILDALLDERVPKQGVGDDHLDELFDRFVDTDRTAVVAIDHLGEPETHPIAMVEAVLGPLDDSISWIAIGRTPPEADCGASVHLPAYQQYVLVDILTSRASQGLSRHAIDHEELRRIAGWAEGDAHDALAALFGGALLASEADERAIDSETAIRGMEAVPRPNASIGRVLALPENRQRVLRRLLDFDTVGESVRVTAEALSRDGALDLSTATITRFLYELAEMGVLERVTAERTTELGRPPSRLEPRFPTLVFRRTFDAV